MHLPRGGAILFPVTLFHRVLRGIALGWFPLMLVLGLATGAPAGAADAAAAPSPLGERDRLAFEALEGGHFVRARELAAAILEDDPKDPIGHFVFGAAIHDGDGNIPLALLHYRQARALVETPSGAALDGFETWHRRILFREMSALSDLGHYDELLDLTATIRHKYDPALWGLDVWPLMKLGRVEQARRAAARALGTGEEIQEIIARNGLCALDGYDACKAMLEAVDESDQPPGVAMRNLAVAAATAGRYEEAEQLLVASTSYPDPDINPWRDLLDLYASEGRLAEAVDAGRRMLEFGRLVPPKQRQYSRAEELTASALVLLLAGRPGRAVAATREALDQPDRAAHWSGTSQEINSEAILLHRAALLAMAERLEEVSAIRPIYGGWGDKLEALRWRLDAWRAGRRVLPILLAGGLRPRENTDHLDRPEISGATWLVFDAVELMGPGPVLALVREVMARPPDPRGLLPPEMREGYLRALECEAQWLRGRWRGCLEAGERARSLLPEAEVLARTRLAARMADAAWRLGEANRAADYYDEVLATDPGILRRLRQRLPLRPPAAGVGVAAEAARRAAATPRFREDSRAPYRLTAAGSSLCLSTIAGTSLACATDPGKRDAPTAAPPRPTPGKPAPIRLPAPEELDSPPERLALALLLEAFSPRVDLSQSDLGSLDGGPAAGRGVDDRTLDILLR